MLCNTTAAHQLIVMKKFSKCIPKKEPGIIINILFISWCIAVTDIRNHIVYKWEMI